MYYVVLKARKAFFEDCESSDHYSVLAPCPAAYDEIIDKSLTNHPFSRGLESAILYGLRMEIILMKMKQENMTRPSVTK